MTTKDPRAGFVVSAEVMLIGVILVLGLVTGWVKLRDQSLSELKDSMAAVDAYMLGSASLWQTGGTRWISGGVVVEPSATGGVTEIWIDENGDPIGSALAAEEVSAPGANPREFRSRDGFLVYGGGTGEAVVP